MLLTAQTCTSSATLLNCQTCLTPNYCSTCATGYFLLADGTCSFGSSCSVQNCQSCINSLTGLLVCQICQPGYTLSGGQCFQCDNVPNCVTCSGPNVCSVCATGFQVVSNTVNTTTTVTCQLIQNPCTYPCATCGSNGQCVTCQAPFTLTPFDNGTCFTCQVAFCKTCGANSITTCS